jgi:CRP-like cAMP-binding protein/Fe-S-cluster-containing hydrogenase component 2
VRVPAPGREAADTSLDELRQRYERRLELMVPARVEDLEGLELFSGIPEKARPKVIEKVRRYLHVVEFGAGDAVLREGEYSDSAYYVVRGTVEVVLPALERERAERARPSVRGGAHARPEEPPGARPGAEGMVGRGGVKGTLILSAIPAAVTPGKRTLLEEGEIFGEISALSRYTVSATVRAASDVRLLQIRLPGLRMLTATSKPFKAFLDERYRERSLKAHLRNVDLFQDLPATLIEELKRNAELLSFAPGAIIAGEGAPADAFYLVRGGFVKLGVHVGAADLAVTYLRKGDHFGESALLLDDTWPFTFQALDHVELVKLTREDFARIVREPSVEDRLWREVAERLKLRGSVSRNPTSSEYVQMAMETGLIHGESVLLIDLATCTRCDECVRGCADAHGGQTRFVREGQKYRNWLVPTACYQCSDPVCMMDCPTGAISRQVGTLEVTIHEPTCIGCTNCAKRCPWGNIMMIEGDEKRSDGKPVELASKCDLCLGRAEGPACVQRCPQGSAVRISFQDMERVTRTLT